MENKLSYWVAPSICYQKNTETISDKQEREEEVIIKICMVYDVTLDELKSLSRKRKFVIPRQVLFYIFREVLKYSLHDCAKLINRDHSTVVYSVNLVRDLMEFDTNFKIQVNKLINYTKFHKSKEEKVVRLKTSKFKGVSWKEKDKRWRAQIFLDGKVKHLGYFKNEHDAYLAYKEELNKYK